MDFDNLSQFGQFWKMQLSCSHLKMQSSGRPTPRLGCIVRGSERGRNFNFVFLILSRIWPYWLIFYELPKPITKIGKLRIQTCKGVGIWSELCFFAFVKCPNSANSVIKTLKLIKDRTRPRKERFKKMLQKHAKMFWRRIAYCSAGIE